MQVRIGTVLLVVAVAGIAAVMYTLVGGVPGENQDSALGKEATETRTVVGIEDVGVWRKALARNEGPVLFRREVPSSRQRSQSRPHDDHNVPELTLMALGPLSAEAVEQLTTTLAASLVGARGRLSEATKLAISAIDFGPLVWLAHAEADVRKHEVCMEMVRRGLYITVPDGTSLPPLPPNVEWLMCGGLRADGVSVQVVFLIVPGDDVEYDAKRAHYNELVELQVETIAGSFNSLPYSERVRRIEAHNAAKKNSDAVYRAQGISSEDKRRMAQQFEKDLIDARLRIDMRSYSVSHK